MRFERVGSAEQIHPEDWNKLARDKTIYASWQWYKASEFHAYSTPTYIIARDYLNRVRGILAAYVTTYEGNPRYVPPSTFRGFFHGALADSEAWFPGLVGGARAGNLNGILIDPTASPQERRTVLSGLMQRFWDLKDTTTKGAWLMYLPSEEARELVSLLPHDALLLFTGGDMWLEVCWDSFEGYLASLSNSRRYAVRREIQSFRESGGQISMHEFSAEICGMMAPLLGNVQTKHGVPKTTEWLTQYLQQQAQCLGSDSLVFICHQQTDPVAFALFHRLDDVLFARIVGIDYKTAVNFEYFNVLFYEPIRFAIRHGYRAIHLGVDFYETKLARGADVRPLWSVIQRFDGSLAEPGSRAVRWNQQAIGEFAARYGRFARRGLDSTLWANLSAP